MNMNMQGVMAQAQKIQREITAKKDQLNKMEFVGKSDWVEITFFGNRTIKKVNILKKDEINSEDIEILEDMIQLATKDAFDQINNAVNDKLGQYAGAFDGLL